MYPVADPGFNLRGGGVDFVNGVGGRKSLKMLKVEVKVILACFGHISNKLCLKNIASEASEEKIEKNSVLDIKKS